MAQQTIDIAPLRAELKGTAVLPGDEGWDRARAAWNLAADRHPAAAVDAESGDDIAATISFAPTTGCGSHRRAPATPPRPALSSTAPCWCAPSP